MGFYCNHQMPRSIQRLTLTKNEHLDSTSLVTLSFKKTNYVLAAFYRAAATLTGFCEPFVVSGRRFFGRCDSDFYLIKKKARD